MVDILGVPQRLEQDIRKADRHQILHRFFTQIMVDAVNLAFVKMLGQCCVQGFGGGQIMTKGLFHHNPRIRARNCMGVQTFGQIAEQGGRDREIKGLHDTITHCAREIGPSIRAARINGNIAQTL